MLDRGVFLLDRVLTQEEKIRRAEEIYQRRRGQYSYGKECRIEASSGDKPKNFLLFKKMFLQMAICLVIYFIFYLIQNSNYIFSEDVINGAKQILSYDIDIVSMYEQTMSFISNQMEGLKPEENSKESPAVTNEIENIIGENIVLENNGIGGATFENVVLENVIQTSSDLEEPTVQTDDEYIKMNFSFVKPVEGVVSSEFGQRDDENPLVSKNHTGIDIAANTGTVIKAAMEGEVTISSTYGDYGHHIKITNGDVSTLYAHCNKLYVKKGDTVTKGQKIAEVGSTGKSTGPHLHFEIIRGTTYINPRKIIEF